MDNFYRLYYMTIHHDYPNVFSPDMTMQSRDKSLVNMVYSMYTLIFRALTYAAKSFRFQDTGHLVCYLENSNLLIKLPIDQYLAKYEIAQMDFLKNQRRFLLLHSIHQKYMKLNYYQFQILFVFGMVSEQFLVMART